MYKRARRKDLQRHIEDIDSCSKNAGSSRLYDMSTVGFVTVLLVLMGGRPTPVEGVRRATDDARYGTPRHGDTTAYLMRYGYLPQSDMETGALRTEAELSRAVKRFQQMAGLSRTGELDTETLDMMAQPRCGVLDIIVRRRARRQLDRRATRQRRYAFGPSRWYHTNLTYRILNYTPKLTRQETRDGLQRAFRAWSEVSLLDFRELMQGTADIMIKFARYYHSDGYPFDGPGITLAHAFFPGEGKGGDVHFDADEAWTYRSLTGVNFFSVAAHEIGHALGLAHSRERNALMYAWYKKYDGTFQLDTDDIVAIQQIYGARHPGSPFPTPTPYFPTTTAPARGVTTTLRPDQPPNPCDTSIDAITVLRGDVFIFRRGWFWRRNKHGIMRGYPEQVTRFFYGFPKDLTQIDAAFERAEDEKIVFFRGQKYWLFEGNHARSSGPLTDFGLPEDLPRIDAVFTWGHNKRTYFVSGDMYWRVNRTSGRVETYRYPRDIGMWGGVPHPVDAAFTHIDGVTYFFQGHKYWEFNNARMRVRTERPGVIESDWLDCNAVMHSDSATTSPFYNIADSSPRSTSVAWWLMIIAMFCTTLVAG